MLLSYPTVSTISYKINPGIFINMVNANLTKTLLFP